VEIVKAAQERRYVDANDGYLRLSIGKAAWPIGVTMVGIHERSAREKLHESDKGHVMGDEVTRKFLQSIKRCLSFAQVRWPPEDIRQLMGWSIECKLQILPNFMFASLGDYNKYAWSYLVFDLVVPWVFPFLLNVESYDVRYSWKSDRLWDRLGRYYETEKKVSEIWPHKIL
jgi:hypothetical protein